MKSSKKLGSNHFILFDFLNNRISIAETDTEYAAYRSNNTVSGHLYTILSSMARTKEGHSRPLRSPRGGGRVPLRGAGGGGEAQDDLPHQGRPSAHVWVEESEWKPDSIQLL